MFQQSLAQSAALFRPPHCHVQDLGLGQDLTDQYVSANIPISAHREAGILFFYLLLILAMGPLGGEMTGLGYSADGVEVSGLRRP
jgi:hypothetical protein